MTSKTVLALCVLAVTLLYTGGCSDGELSGMGGGNPQVSIDASSKGLVVFSASGEGGSDLYLYDFSTNKAHCLARTPDYEQTPAFDPSGTLVVYAASPQSGGSGHIYVQPIGGGSRRQVTSDNAVDDYGPRFSPDGRRIAFARAYLHRPYSMGGYTWDSWDICVMNADGTGLRRLTNENYYGAYPPCFHTNDTIIFAAERHSVLKSTIFEIKIARTMKAPRVLAFGIAPYCCANEDRITFVDDLAVPYDYEVWTSRADGTRRKQITSLHSYIEHLACAHKAKRVLFLSDPSRNGHPELWQVDLSTGTTTRLADASLFQDPGNWGKP